MVPSRIANEEAVVSAVFSIASVVLDYIYRSTDLEDVCIYEFYQCFVKDSMPKNAASRRLNERYYFTDDHPDHKSHCLRRVNATSERTPIFSGAKPPADKNTESYYLFRLSMFAPWRNLEDLLLEEETSWEVAYDRIWDGVEEVYRIVADNVTHQTDYRDLLDILINYSGVLFLPPVEYLFSGVTREFLEAHVFIPVNSGETDTVGLDDCSFKSISGTRIVVKGNRFLVLGREERVVSTKLAKSSSTSSTAPQRTTSLFYETFDDSSASPSIFPSIEFQYIANSIMVSLPGIRTSSLTAPQIAVLPIKRCIVEEDVYNAASSSSMMSFTNLPFSPMHKSSGRSSSSGWKHVLGFEESMKSEGRSKRMGSSSSLSSSSITSRVDSLKLSDKDVVDGNNSNSSSNEVINVLAIPSILESDTHVQHFVNTLQRDSSIAELAIELDGFLSEFKRHHHPSRESHRRLVAYTTKFRQAIDAYNVLTTLDRAALKSFWLGYESFVTCSCYSDGNLLEELTTLDRLFRIKFSYLSIQRLATLKEVLGIPESFGYEDLEELVYVAGSYFLKLDSSEYVITPRQKLDCILSCQTSIADWLTTSNTTSDHRHGADLLLPLLLYVLVRSNTSRLISQLWYVYRYHWQKMDGLMSYALTNVLACVAFFEGVEGEERFVLREEDERVLRELLDLGGGGSSGYSYDNGGSSSGGGDGLDGRSTPILYSPTSPQEEMIVLASSK